MNIDITIIRKDGGIKREFNFSGTNTKYKNITIISNLSNLKSKEIR